MRKKSFFDLQFFAEGGDGNAGNGGGESVTTFLGNGRESGGAKPSDTGGGSAGASPTGAGPTGAGVSEPARPVNVMSDPAEAQARTQQSGSAQRQGTAPDQYEPFQVPEGMELDSRQFGEAQGVFKELGLTQEQAQKLVDLHAKNWIGAVDAYESELTRRVADWGERTKADPEFGGARLNESLASVRRAISHVGGEGLEKALNETGSINHPAIFAAFARMGRLFAEDGFVEGRSAPGSGESNSPSDMARRVYPGMRHN